jgi:hypothetical protein
VRPRSPFAVTGGPRAGPIRLLPPQLVEMMRRSAIHSVGCASGLLATSRTRPSRDGTIPTRPPRCSASASSSPSSSTRRSCGRCRAGRGGAVRRLELVAAELTRSHPSENAPRGRRAGDGGGARRAIPGHREVTPRLRSDRRVTPHMLRRRTRPSHRSPTVAPYEQTRAGRRRCPSRSSASRVASSTGSMIRGRRAVPRARAAYPAGSRTLPRRLSRIFLGLDLLRRVRRRSERNSRR